MERCVRVLEEMVEDMKRIRVEVAGMRREMRVARGEWMRGDRSESERESEEREESKEEGTNGEGDGNEGEEGSGNSMTGGGGHGRISGEEDRRDVGGTEKEEEGELTCGMGRKEEDEARGQKTEGGERSCEGEKVESKTGEMERIVGEMRRRKEAEKEMRKRESWLEEMEKEEEGDGEERRSGEEERRGKTREEETNERREEDMEIWKRVERNAEEERKRREKKEEERKKKEEEEEKERREKRRKNVICRGIEGEGPRERRRAAELIMEREVGDWIGVVGVVERVGDEGVVLIMELEKEEDKKRVLDKGWGIRRKWEVGVDEDLTWVERKARCI